jgi:hypothetical protein
LASRAGDTRALWIEPSTDLVSIAVMAAGWPAIVATGS